MVRGIRGRRHCRIVALRYALIEYQYDTTVPLLHVLGAPVVGITTVSPHIPSRRAVRARLGLTLGLTLALALALALTLTLAL
jgi:hypothetical protein